MGLEFDLYFLPIVKELSSSPGFLWETRKQSKELQHGNTPLDETAKNERKS